VNAARFLIELQIRGVSRNMLDASTAARRFMESIGKDEVREQRAW
jgi:hypothetical protein